MSDLTPEALAPFPDKCPGPFGGSCGVLFGGEMYHMWPCPESGAVTTMNSIIEYRMAQAWAEGHGSSCIACVCSACDEPNPYWKEEWGTPNWPK